MKMENLLLTPNEQKLLLKFKKFLESNYNLNIYLPEYIPSCETDVVVATVRGKNINLVKNFIQKKLNEMNQKHEQRVTLQNNVTTITLSDSSDSDSSKTVPMETQQKRKRKQRRSRKKRAVNKEVNKLEDMSSTILVEDSNESEVDESVQDKSKDKSSSSLDFLPLDAQKENKMNLNKINGDPSSSMKLKDESPISSKTESTIPSPSFSSIDNSQICETFSKHIPLEETIVLSDSPPPTPDFISLNSGKKKENIPKGIDDSDIIIIEDEIPRPVIVPRCLRPVVIDGSNVAREHGKITTTFSCKGIKIAIDYFLQRGHPQVTAFVPHFRRHCKFGPIFTTDQNLLEELAKEQHVVFTPSRRINNKTITCYDDRFIVELATKTGGVILSNDNYRDLAAENEEFKKTIIERLLMFCFVGDILMIPQDPLGRNGPSLENFLSIPAC